MGKREWGCEMKNEIRKRMKELRKLQTESQIIKKSHKIEEKLFSLPEFLKSKKVMFYLSKRDEVRTEKMVLRSISDGKAVFLPKTDIKKKEMRVYEISSLDQLVMGPYGVLEPQALGKDAEPKNIECVVVPGIAFDVHGNRIGHGLGYYDKFLKKVGKDTCLIGLGFDFQIVGIKIPTQHYDVKMNFVVTEKRVIRCER